MNAELIINGDAYSPSDYAAFPSHTPMREELTEALKDWYKEREIKIQTSGSTGEPKTIVLQRESIEISAKMTAQFFKLQPGATALLCMPVDRIAGRMMLYRALAHGWRLTVTKPDGHPLAQAEGDFDFAAMSPLQASNSIGRLHRVRTLLVGGAPVSTKLARDLASIQGLAAYETYGMTETYTHIAARAISPEPEETFTTLPGVKISSTDNDALVINAPHLPKPVTTNDVIRIAGPHHFHWLGRADNVINSGGIKFNAEQLEKAIAPMLKQRFFITGTADDKLGERIVLVIEGTLPPAVEIAALKRRMSDVHGKYAVPRQVCTVEHFEETPTGKIKRKLHL
jgi:O-succinylbenzoic acid--CoA ligase